MSVKESSGVSEHSEIPARRWAGTKSLIRSIAVALLIAFVVKTTVAESYRVQTDAVAPEVPRNAFVLAYRLAGEFETGDIILFTADGARTLASRVVRTVPAGIVIQRNNEPELTIAMEQIVGRVVLVTR